MEVFRVRVPVRAAAAGAGMSVVLGVVSAASATPPFTGLGDLHDGLAVSRARAVSADGSVVVGESGGTGTEGVRAIRWTRDGGMEALAFPEPEYPGFSDMPQSQAIGVSADGRTAVGRYIIGRTGDWRAVRWTAGHAVRLGVFASIDNNSAYAVSGDGRFIAGAAEQLSGGGRAFRWGEGRGYDDLGFLPPDGALHSTAHGITDDGRLVVGASSFYSPDPQQSFATEAVVWTAEAGMVGLGDLSGGLHESEALAAAADACAIVGYGTSNLGREAAVWSAGSLIGLGDLPGGAFDSRALSVSGDGLTVVGIASTDRGEEAFLWTAALGMVSLERYAMDRLGADLSGWTLQVASDISQDGGTIVGWGINPLGNTEGFVMTIPAPGTAALAGFALLAFGRRRR